MKLTEQEWEECLEAVQVRVSNPIRQITLLVDLYRAVVDGTFPAGPENDRRQDRLESVCGSMGASFQNVAAVARTQAVIEQKKRSPL